MKKFTLLLCMIIMAHVSFGQILMSENFSGNTFPPTGWTIDANAANWSKAASANAGGTAPEARLYYAPQFNGTSRLISPAINTTGLTSVLINFRQFIDWYANPFTIKIETRSGGGAWTTVNSVSPTGNVGPQSKLLLVSNANVGAADFQFCFTFTGDSYNIDYWYIDDARVLIANPLDAAMNSINMVSYLAAGTYPVVGQIMNYGTDNLTAANINWSLDNGTIHTNALNGLNMALGSTSNFTASDSVTFTPGNHTLAVWVSNPNGAAADSNTSNDTIFSVFHIASQGTLRRPLYEEFTSSTCAPCASFNIPTFDPFIVQHEAEICLVHYPMNWPGAGDPYFTAQNEVRRFFYGVSYVPDLYVEGKQVPTTAAGINSALTASLAKPSYMTISGTHNVNGNIVTGDMVINSYISANLTAYIAIVEETFDNHSTNGETHFPNLMLAMAPGPYGTPVELTDGGSTTVSYTVDMTGTHVEHMSDIKLVMWVQDSVTRMLFQSNYSDLVTGIDNHTVLQDVQVYPNPSTGLITVQHQNTIDNLTIYNNFGQIVRQFNDFEAKLIDLSSLDNGTYFMRITNGSESKTIKIALIK